MARTPRRIVSGKVYEICFRARSGLPLPPLRIIKAIIRSAIARTQRDAKVILNHDMWMTNHPHLILIAKDAEQCKRFYTELQKRLTDAIKRLLGLKSLLLWEGRPMVAEIADLEAAIDRIAYLYSNPSKADLVDTIEQYPGESSWKAFKQTAHCIKAAYTTNEKWIRLPFLTELPAASLTERQDRFFEEKFISQYKVSHDLTIQPNAWMAVFGVTEPAEIAEINTRILERIRFNEATSRTKRNHEGRRPMGAARLALQPILREHIPKKRSRKVFVLCSINELRIKLIQEHQEFSRHLKLLYQRWKVGDLSVLWPPGAFRPPAPPIANALV